MGARSLLALLLAFTLIAAACSGDDSAPDAGPEPETDVPAQEPEQEPESDDSGSADDSSGEDAVAEPPVDEPTSDTGSPPDPYAFLPFAPAPELFAQPEAAATASEQLTAMWRTVTDIVLGDRRAADANLWSEMDRSAQQAAPDIVLAAVSASASLSVETLSAIEAYATAGAAAGYDPEITDFFSARAEGAAAIRQLNQLIYDAVDIGRTMSHDGRACLAAAIVGDGDDCEDDPEADALITQLIADSEAVAPDELDEADDGLPPEFDFCATWDPVLTDLGGLAQIFDLLVEGALIEFRFLGREECRFQAELDGGPEAEIVWGPQQATDAYTELYAQVVAAGIESPFDENVYDNDADEVAQPKLRETIVAHMMAGAGAADLIGGVAEPHARLGLITIAYMSAVELWWQQMILDLGLDTAEDPDQVVFDAFFGCVPDPFQRPLDTSGCSAEEARAAELVLFTVEYSDFRIGAEEQDIVDWEDVQEVFPLCQIWAAVLQAIPADQAMRIDFQVVQLSTEDLLAMEGCDTGIAQPGTEVDDGG